MRRILLSVLLGIMTSVAGAQDESTGLSHLIDLTRQGQQSQLIQYASSLLSNENLPPVDRSIVLTYLGHAYQETGDSHTAIGCYEKALAILDHDGHHPAEYATTLGAMAALYAEIGQADAAKHMLFRSLHLLQKDGDHHAAIAWIWNDLATIAANEHSNREAHKCIAHARTESQLDPNISSDESAALLTTQAVVAELDGDPRAAAADYQHALAFSKQSHDDLHPETAWLYVLIGDAYLRAGELASAREMTARGLSLLEAGSGRQSPRYYLGKLLYSKVLDASGSHQEASQLRQEAQAAMSAGSKRAQGEISISALH